MTPESSPHRLIRHEGYLPFSALNMGDKILLSAGIGENDRQCILNVIGRISDTRVVFSFQQLNRFYFWDQKHIDHLLKDGTELISGFSTKIRGSWGVAHLPFPSDYTGLKNGVSNWFLKPGDRWLYTEDVNTIVAQKGSLTSHEES